LSADFSKDKVEQIVEELRWEFLMYLGSSRFLNKGYKLFLTLLTF